MSATSSPVPQYPSQLQSYINPSNGKVETRVLGQGYATSLLPFHTHGSFTVFNSSDYNSDVNHNQVDRTHLSQYDSSSHSPHFQSYDTQSLPYGNGAHSMAKSCYSHPQPNGLPHKNSLTKLNGIDSRYEDGNSFYPSAHLPSNVHLTGSSAPGSMLSNSNWLELIAEQKLSSNGTIADTTGASRKTSASVMAQVAAAAAVSPKNSSTNATSKVKLKNVENGVTTDSTSEHSAGYNSIFMQIRDVNRESESELEFLVKSLRVLQNTPVTTIILALVLFLPIGMVILGVRYLHGCPEEPFLPIYLLVGGCFGMLKMFTIIWRHLRERKNAQSFDVLDGEYQSDFITNRSTQFTDTVLSLFLLSWFIYGNYLTWKIFMPSFSSQLYTPENWCEKSLYMFCVVQICICYAIIVVFLFSTLCLLCARHICCFADKQTLISPSNNCGR